jgi:hypothetical protein
MIDERNFYCKPMSGESDRAIGAAERVGYYFGLQCAGNMSSQCQHGDGGGRMLNALRILIDAEMRRIVAELPPGTIDNW